MKKVFVLIGLLISFAGFAQRGNHYKTSDSLLFEISKLQQENNSFYSDGQFASQRGKSKLREDNTIFFSALIAYTLQGMRSELSPNGRILSDVISGQVMSNYSHFRNAQGGYTYNFWSRNPKVFCPNNKFMSTHSYFDLADDADDTSIIYLTDSTMKKDATFVKTALMAHANGRGGKIKNTYHDSRKWRAYSTWFGKKMPVEFDVCVMTNILSFVYENKLLLTDEDKETVLFIKQMIQSGRYINESYYISPSYRKPAVVLYHLARLISRYNIPELNDCKPILIKDIENRLSTTDEFMEKVILSSSLMRLGVACKPLVYPAKGNDEWKHYSFFGANMFSVYARPSLRWVSKLKTFHTPYYCEAYSIALLLEYESLKERSK